jgi:hypothetical protein
MDTIPDQRARQALEEAIASGDFDQVPGRGQPLQLQGNDLLVPATHRLFFKVLKNANVVPEWIYLGRTAEDLINDLHCQINCHKERMHRLRTDSITGRATDFKSTFQAAHKVHAHYRSEFELLAEQVQRHADRFNTTAPDGAQRLAFRASTFLERFDQIWPWASQDRRPEST